MKRSTPRFLRVLSLLLAALLLLPILSACKDDQSKTPTGILDILEKTPAAQDDDHKIYNSIRPLDLPGIGSNVSIESGVGDLLLLYDTESAGDLIFGQRSVYDLTSGSTLYVAKSAASNSYEVREQLPEISLYRGGLFQVREAVREAEETKLFETETSTEVAETAAETSPWRRSTEARYGDHYDQETEIDYWDLGQIETEPATDYWGWTTEAATEPETELPGKTLPVIDHENYEWTIDSQTLYSLYNQKGEVLLTSEDPIEVEVDYDDDDTAIILVTADQVTYRFNEATQTLGRVGGQSASLTSSPLEDADVEEVAEGYLTQIGDSEVRVLVKDTGALAAYYAFPSYADEKAAYSLNGGNVLIQYYVHVPQLDGIEIKDDEYDIEILSGEESGKYTMKTLLLSVETGKASEIEFPYLVAGIVTQYAKNAELDLVDTVEAVAALYAIPKDKRLDLSEHAAIFATIDNDATVSKLSLVRDDEIDLPELVYEDRFVIRVSGVTDSSRRYLYDGEGNLIGDITGSSLYKEWILSDTGVFDYNGDLLFDYAAANYTVAQKCDTYIVFVGTGKELGSMYLFTGDKNAIVTLATAQDNAVLTWQRASAGCFIIRREKDDGSYIYELYSNGKVMGTFRHEPEVVHTSDPAMLLQVKQSSKTLYYLLYSGSGTSSVTEPEELVGDDMSLIDEDEEGKLQDLLKAMMSGTAMEELGSMKATYFNSLLVTPNQIYCQIPISVLPSSQSISTSVEVITSKLGLKDRTWFHYYDGKDVLSAHLSSGQQVWWAKSGSKLLILAELAD